MNRFLVFTLLTLFSFVVEAAVNTVTDNTAHQARVDNFMAHERNNPVRTASEINEYYMPWSANTFDVPYLALPLHLVTIVGEPKSVMLPPAPGETEPRVKFYIHPESEDLYRPLVEKYGYSGAVKAIPSSSIRTMHTHDTDSSFFLKAGIAKLHNDIVRIVPGWEIRRSVLLSQMIQKSPSREVWRQNGAVIVPDRVGVYLKSEVGIHVRIDDKQLDVTEHGYLEREDEFLNEFADYDVRAYLSLFVEQNGEPPLIIKLWKQSGKSFYKFIAEYLFRPVVQKNTFFMLKQGLTPALHGQNMVFALNKADNSIAYTLHRDVGSFRVNPFLRWINGLPIEDIITDNTLKDFGFNQAAKKYEEYYQGHFFDSVFLYNYGPTIEKYVPRFSATKLSGVLDEILKEEMVKALPITSDSVAVMNVTEYLQAYIDQNIPKLKGRRINEMADSEKQAWQEWLHIQTSSRATVELPPNWSKQWMSEAPILTEYGVVAKVADRLMLVPLTTSAPNQKNPCARAFK